MEEGCLHRVGCVVADELHLLGDPRRGYLLEVLLTKLLYMNRRADRSVVDGWLVVGRNVCTARMWLGHRLDCAIGIAVECS